MAMTVVDTNHGQRLQCVPIKIIIEAGCPPYCQLPSNAIRNKSISNSNHKREIKLKRDNKKCDIEKRRISLPAWKTEYQDSISKIGHAIMKVKLHRLKKKTVPVHQYAAT